MANATAPIKEAGKPVYFYNGTFAGRWRCAKPGCVGSVGRSWRDEGRVYCWSCEKERGVK